MRLEMQEDGARRDRRGGPGGRDREFQSRDPDIRDGQGLGFLFAGVKRRGHGQRSQPDRARLSAVADKSQRDQWLVEIRAGDAQETGKLSDRRRPEGHRDRLRYTRVEGKRGRRNGKLGGIDRQRAHLQWQAARVLHMERLLDHPAGRDRAVVQPGDLFEVVQSQGMAVDGADRPYVRTVQYQRVDDPVHNEGRQIRLVDAEAVRGGSAADAGRSDGSHGLAFHEQESRFGRTAEIAVGDQFEGTAFVGGQHDRELVLRRRPADVIFSHRDQLDRSADVDFRQENHRQSCRDAERGLQRIVALDGQIGQVDTLRQLPGVEGDVHVLGACRWHASRSGLESQPGNLFTDLERQRSRSGIRHDERFDLRIARRHGQIERDRQDAKGRRRNALSVHPQRYQRLVRIVTRNTQGPGEQSERGRREGDPEAHAATRRNERGTLRGHELGGIARDGADVKRTSPQIPDREDPSPVRAKLDRTEVQTHRR